MGFPCTMIFICSLSYIYFCFFAFINGQIDLCLVEAIIISFPCPDKLSISHAFNMDRHWKDIFVILHWVYIIFYPLVILKKYTLIYLQICGHIVFKLWGCVYQGISLLWYFLGHAPMHSFIVPDLIVWAVCAYWQTNCWWGWIHICGWHITMGFCDVIPVNSIPWTD